MRKNGGEGMEKDGKRIKRWRTGATKLQGAAYLRDMAEQGWILEDMNHLMYFFREEEPRYLRYRLEERESVLTEEERAAYEKDGWTEVCHYELEYIFVREREPFADDEEIDRQDLAESIDKQLKEDLGLRKNMFLVTVLIIGGFLLLFLLQEGFDGIKKEMIANLMVSFGPNLFFIFLGGWLVNHRLKKKKRQLEEGDIPAEYADWRKQKRSGIIVVSMLVLVIGWAVCIEAEWNQKKYDMPKEISYWDVPAVRLERLEEGELEPIGKKVSSIKELEGLHLGMSLYEQSEYQRLRWLSNFNNYVVDHRWLLITEQVETNQRVLNTSGEEIWLDGKYDHFILEFLAEKQYRDDLEWEKEKLSTKYGMEKHDIITETAKGNFDELHICRTEFGDKTVLHILCREGTQVMELNYDGQADADDVLLEIQRVFLAQK